MDINIVAAMTKRDRVIGKDNKLPWRLPDDLKRFKQTTMGNVIIMGRKTHESIGKSLPGRTNIVISKQLDLGIEGALVCHSLDEAIDRAKSETWKAGPITNNQGKITGYSINCPACNCYHFIQTNGVTKWEFNDDVKNPTFSPSLEVRHINSNSITKCHSFIRNGQIQYLNDCDHEMAGQTVILPNIDRDIFIIGGESLYKQTIEYADKLYITEIDNEFEGDAFFPIIPDCFIEVDRDNYTSPFQHSYIIYQK